ncbi:MAG: YggT family protein [Pseudomonadota bacterium]
MAFIGDILLMLLGIYFWIIIVYVMIGWLIAFDILNARNARARQIIDALGRMVEPALAPIRRVIPAIAGIDISPIILIILIQIIQRAIVHIFYM